MKESPMDLDELVYHISKTMTLEKKTFRKAAEEAANQLLPQHLVGPFIVFVANADTEEDPVYSLYLAYETGELSYSNLELLAEKM
ncbi:MAG: hypothetical protein NZ822_00590 [Patescibacteria group bacterium]|nr:hypothetical protein [Patescibacteria group bacterium]